MVTYHGLWGFETEKSSEIGKSYGLKASHAGSPRRLPTLDGLLPPVRLGVASERPATMRHHGIYKQMPVLPQYFLSTARRYAPAPCYMPARATTAPNLHRALPGSPSGLVAN